MGDKELYKAGDIGQEEIERLKHIEYPNYVSETVLNGIDLESKRVLDVGAGPNAKLAEFVHGRKGEYVSLDVRADVLEEMKKKLEAIGVPFYGVRADVKALPFADGAFDVVHQRFVLMNIKPETRRQALEEVLRVGKKDIVLIEYNWEYLKSTESPEIIERFRSLAFQIMGRFSTDPYMGKKFEELFEEVAPGLNYSLQGFRREEDMANTPEVILVLKGMQQISKNVLKDEGLSEEARRLIEELSKTPVKLSPPEVVVATIKM